MEELRPMKTLKTFFYLTLLAAILCCNISVNNGGYHAESGEQYYITVVVLPLQYQMVIKHSYEDVVTSPSGQATLKEKTKVRVYLGRLEEILYPGFIRESKLVYDYTS
jgi:hypothetical protein